jgi:hypothetical protein
MDHNMDSGVPIRKKAKSQSECQSVSEWKKVEAGVVEGSVLGPVLFLLFIADINSYLPETSNLHKFADDLLNYEIIFNRIIKFQLI